MEATKKILGLFLVYLVFICTILLFPTGSWAACVGPAQSDVVSAVSAAERGATVQVCSGSAEWTTEASCSGYPSLLCLTKGIKLEGGIGGTTTITLAGSSDYGQILYLPDSTAGINNETLEITGFTFEGNSVNKNQGLIHIYNKSANILSNIRIHHNTFQNAYHTGISIDGPVYGVAFYNKFINVNYVFRTFGMDKLSWGLVPREYGTATNFFFEDNTISCTKSIECGTVDYGQGAPGVVYRYNSLDLTNAKLSSLWTIHGLQSMATKAGKSCQAYQCGYAGRGDDCLDSDCADPTVDSCGQWSAIKSEFYGNSISNSPAYSVWIAQRGSWMLMFYNTLDNSTPRIGYSQYSCDSCQSPASPAYSQHVQNTYIWANYGDGNLRVMSKLLDHCADYAGGTPIAENVDYWNHKTDFSDNSTHGMGCGSLANRPAACTTGVGYWATNQSCSDLTGMVGTAPTTPISGTLYKCTATDTWTAYYTPYTYPHPLRSAGGALSPPSGLQITN